MTPLERAARVLCDRAGRDPDEVCIGEGHATGKTWLGWEAFESDARAVIAAIREPSEAMVGPAYGECHHPNDVPLHIWQTMIDALLSEERT